MYPNEFDYHRADTVAEALDLLAKHSDQETELLAGGHSLLPTMKSGLASPDVVIDISEIEALQGIEHGEDTVSIGAVTTYSTVTDDDAMWAASPAFTEAVSNIGDVQVRNKGTIGGNLAHADPASDLPGAALAADATLVIQGPDGERRVDADDFFMGMYMTDVGEGELLTSVELPVAGEDAVGAYAKKPSPSSGYAMVGVAAMLTTDGETVTSASVGANGAMDHGIRLEPVEAALEGAALTEDAMAEAASHATDDLDTMMLMEDPQASAEFRAQLLEVYTERALNSAADRAGAQTPAAAD